MRLRGCGFEAFRSGGVSRAVRVEEACKFLCALGEKANALLVKASTRPFSAAERFWGCRVVRETAHQFPFLASLMFWLISLLVEKFFLYFFFISQSLF